MKPILRIISPIIISLLGLFHPFAAYGQDDYYVPNDFNDHFLTPQNLGLTTPQTSDFAKYGNLAIDHYNGLLNLDIPLSGYKDMDFDLPLSIKYVSSGFVPSKRPGLVGLNWILNFGGVITRQVQGSPDDARGYHTGSNYSKYPKDGLLAAVRDRKIYTASQLSNFEVASGDKKYDYEPDIFTFTMGNHRGSFIIGNDGSIKLLSNDTQYKIDITQLYVQTYSTTGAPATSRIRITTPDGYVYEFGGETSFLEYTEPNNPKYCTVRSRHIVAWHLNSIKAPNGRKAEFTYNSVLQSYQYFYYSYYYSLVNIRSHPLGGGHSEFDTETNLQVDKINMKDNIYAPIISSVRIDGDTKISFTTGNKNPFYDNNDEPSKSLNAVQYYNRGDKIKEITFGYDTYSRYYFLSSVNDNGYKYGFAYNSVSSSSLPSPKTIWVDHWGFWTGSSLADPSNKTSYCYNIDSNKAVNTNYASFALLESVKYPTKGNTYIEYEPNTYRKYHTTSPSSLEYIQRDTTSNIPGGGARVKKITDEGGVTRTFEYRKPSSQNSSGVIGLKPKYKIADKQSWSNTTMTSSGQWYESHYDSDNLTISSNTFGTDNLLGEYHIGYTDVIEKFLDGSYIHYHYTSRIDIPDRCDVQFKMEQLGDTQYLGMTTNLTRYELAEKHQLYTINDMSRFRGKIRSKTYLNSSGTLVKKIETTYEDLSSNSLPSNVSLRSNARGKSASKIYLKPSLVTEEKITESDVVRTVKYYYNTNNQLSRKETTNSDNSIHSISNTYVTDPDVNLNSGAQWLINKNMINSPLQITQNVNGSVVEVIKFDYKFENNMPVLQHILLLETTTPLAEGSPGFNNGLKVRETYHKYDAYGNPLFITQSDGANVVYLWGYTGQYPIAKIVNATYDEVNAALGQTPESISALPFPVIYHIAAKLRDNLPQASITDYTYRPQIGITRITDPSGRKTFYEYDEFNRLSRIRDDSFTILDHYEYNYKKEL